MNLVGHQDSGLRQAQLLRQRGQVGLQTSGIVPAISVDIEKLGDGLLDTLDIDNLEINIEKRGDYWTRRDLYSLYPYVNDSGPTYYADDFAGYDGDDAELFTAIIKIIKIAKMVYDIIDAIKNI